MRVFGSDSIKNMMGKFGIPEDEPIEASMVSRAIESAQEKIEGFHFDSRKHTLKYDDVLNQQRTSVYTKRSKILNNDVAYIESYLKELCDKDAEFAKIFEEKKAQYGNSMTEVMRAVLLQIYDVVWMDHLEYMDNLRQSVNLRAYGQRDPLVEYKKEGLEVYKHLDNRVAADLKSFTSHIDGVFANMKMQEVQKTREEVGDIGRNDPCPCGSGEKLKKCDCKEYAHMR
jgi:preprotein translocase subunit SecA